MSIILLVVIGAAAGFIATRLMKVNVDLPSAMGIGILGALVGGLALRFLMAAAGWAISFVVAVMGAMALIWIWKQIGRRK
jgi:uncharacterized membrane protein YeaQ/YmgE (transglycosylase-associated protein family)